MLINQPENELEIQSDITTPLEVDILKEKSKEIAKLKRVPYSDVEIIKALMDNHFNYTATAAILNRDYPNNPKITPLTIRKIVENNELLSDVETESTLNLVEQAEIQLLKLIQSGDYRAIAFALEGKGHVKGWQTKNSIMAQTVNIQNNNNVIPELEQQKPKEVILINGVEFDV